jgi:multiple sugar transport system permease protein
MATTTAALPARSGESRRRGGGLSLEAGWGVAIVLPYVVFFLIFVVWPVVYGAWIGSDPASYAELFSDPIFSRTALNTVVFLALAINLKLFLALLLSGFFATARPWIRWLSVIFILPWAVPSIPTIFSFRWMLNSEWGMVNGLLWDAFGIEGPWWLVDPQLAFGSVITVHIWKYLPFWTLILLAGRLSIPTDLYEAARIDGATPFQQFAYVTWPNLKNLYITSTLLSTIWSLGDFNSVYLLTGGGPAELTHVLATLGIRYAFNLHEIGVGVACVMVALPVLVPLVILLVRRLGGGRAEA